MGLVKQYSRIAHHTLVGLTGSTFSVPVSNDFTDGTWTIYDLALSEFGVNEADKKLYIRIDDEIKEIGFAATMSLSENLEQTLALGNNMGTYSIYMDSGKLFSTNGTSSFSLSDTTATLISEQQEYNIPTNSFGYNEVKTMKETITTGTSSTTIFTITGAQLPDDSVCKVIVSTQGIQTNNSLYYSNEIFAFYHSVAGSVTQIGIDQNQRTNMVDGSVIVSTDGTDINVIINGDGDGSSSYYWATTITYRISTAL